MIRLGFRKLAWGCRVQTGNPAVSSKVWPRDGERKRAGDSPFTGSVSSRQGLFPPHIGPQAPCLEVLHHHLDILRLLLASSVPCESGESAPLPFGDHTPRQRQSSHGHSVPFPTRLHRQSWDSLEEGRLPSCSALSILPLLEGSVIKNGWQHLVMTRCPQNCCPRRWISCCQQIQ